MWLVWVSGTDRPFSGKVASRRGCLDRKGKVCEKAERGFGVLSLLKRRKKLILSVSGRREQVGRELNDSTHKGPAR